MKKGFKENLFLLKHSIFPLVHLVIPILGIIIFLTYLKLNNHEAIGLTVNFFQLITLCYPLIIAWVCTIVFEQEIEAGNGFYILSSISRIKSLSNKLFIIICSGLISCLIVTLGYGLLVSLLFTNINLTISILIKSAFVIWGSNLFLYFFHTWVVLQFGKNANFACAVVEILLSALLLTGLGVVIWSFIPSAWGTRLIPILFAEAYKMPKAQLIIPISTTIIIMIVMTIMMLLLLCIWFKRWEGRNNEE